MLRCPECGSAEVVDGQLSSEYQPRFLLKGLRWFSLYRPPSLTRDLFSACLSCGLVWSHVNAAELRAILDSKGSAHLKAALAKAKNGA